MQRDLIDAPRFTLRGKRIVTAIEAGFVGIEQLVFDDPFGQRENELTQCLSETQKETSRLDALIDDGYRRLDTNAKQVMDAIKLIARNAFYTLLIPFKKSYDNYRDDHTLLRNLTHAHGLLIETKTLLRIILYPTAHYAPTLRKIVEDLLHRINLTLPELPDGTSRKIIFELGSSQGIELATENQYFGHYY